MTVVGSGTNPDSDDTAGAGGLDSPGVEDAAGDLEAQCAQLALERDNWRALAGALFDLHLARTDAWRNESFGLEAGGWPLWRHQQLPMDD